MLTPSSATNPLATHGMVTSPHTLASQSGLHILRKGGTAVESAIAVAATLAVVYPHMCSLGGDAFWLIANAGEKTLLAINASGRSSENATRDLYRKRNLSRIPKKGPLAALTVPGMVSGLDAAYRYNAEHLRKTMDIGELLDDATGYAADGVPASTSFVAYSRRALLRHKINPRTYPIDTAFASIFLSDGKAFTVGERLVQRDLAGVLTTLSSEGLQSFYTGSIAEAIVDDMHGRGGLLTAGDLARHTATLCEPIAVPYRDAVAYNVPPNSQGMASLEILNCLNAFDISGMRGGTGDGSADYYHLLVEATKLAFSDRDRYLTDPDFSDIPLDELLSRAHGIEHAGRIRMDRACEYRGKPDPKGDTVWFGVVDGEGNAVSCIQSIYHDFGSGVVPGGTGILLQNRGCFFSLNPAHPNTLAPGKRTFHTLNPAMLFRNGRPLLVYGTMGGEGQPQTQAALVTRMLDFGMTPNEAIYAPRWLYGSAFGEPTANLTVESRIDRSIREDLAARGHSVITTEAFSDIMGHAGAIRVDYEKDGLLLRGASDVRSDGAAVGY